MPKPCSMWKNLTLKVAMTRDQDKKKKATPFFWCASKTVRIRKEDKHLEHGRPLIVLEADDPADNCVIVVFPDRLVAQTKDFETIIHKPKTKGDVAPRKA